MADLQVVRVPVLDTGIGREAGFDSDAHLIEVAAAERAAQPPHVRAFMDRFDEELERAVIWGAGE